MSITLGITKSVKVKNDTTLRSITLEQLIDLNSKLTSTKKEAYPVIWSHTGLRGEYTPTNIGFIDIDTTEYVQDILSNTDKIFSNIPNIIFLQESFSGKLHIIYKITEEPIEDSDQYIQQHTLYTITILHTLKNLGYDYFKLDNNSQKIIDTHSLRWSQSLFLSGKTIHQHPLGAVALTISDKLEKQLTSLYRAYFPTKTKTKTTTTKTLFTTENTSSTTKLLINRDVTVFGYSGNDARWRIASTLNAMLGEEEAQRFIEDHFIIVNKNDYNTNWINNFQSAQDWLLNTFPELKYKEEDTTTADNVLLPGEYMIDRIDEIEKLFNKHKRLCISAPCGTGKTTLINGKGKPCDEPDLFNQHTNITGLAQRLNAVVIVPFNITNHLYNNLTEISTESTSKYDKNKPCVMVWDQAIKYDLTDRVVIVDESHTLFHDRTYRQSAITLMNKLKTVKRVICISATPEGEIEELNLHLIKYTQQKQVVLVNSYNTNKKLEPMILKRILNAKDKWDNIAVFGDNIARKLYFSLIDAGITMDELCLLHSRTKETEDFNKVRDNELLHKKITISTCIAYNGLNFNNEGTIHIILEHSDNTAGELIQCIGRFRKAKKVLVHIYHHDKRDEEMSLEDKRHFAKIYKSPLIDDFSDLLDDNNYEAMNIIEEYREVYTSWEYTKSKMIEIAPYIRFQNETIIENLEKNITIINKHKRKYEAKALEDCINGNIDNNIIDDYYKDFTHIYSKSAVKIGKDNLDRLLSLQKNESLASTKLKNILEIISIITINKDTYQANINFLKEAQQNDNNSITKKRITSRINRIKKLYNKYHKYHNLALQDVFSDLEDIFLDEHQEYVDKKSKAGKIGGRATKNNKKCAIYNYLDLPVAIFNSYKEAADWCGLKLVKKDQQITFNTHEFYRDDYLGTPVFDMVNYYTDIRVFTVRDYDGEDDKTCYQKCYTSLDDMMSHQFKNSTRIYKGKPKIEHYQRVHADVILEDVELDRQFMVEMFNYDEEDIRWAKGDFYLPF